MICQLDIIKETTAKILEQTPEVVVRYCLHRDVLKLSPDAPEMQAAKENLKLSRCIQDLASEQREDGGWGAFHSSLEMLARLFPSWIHFAQSSIAWLWEQRNQQGYRDFGPRPGSKSYLPLSDSWRDRKNRQFDWTTRILILLRKYYDDISVL